MWWLDSIDRMANMSGWVAVRLPGSQDRIARTTALRARGRRGPEQLFLSRCAAPYMTGIRKLCEFSGEEFSNAVLELGVIDPSKSLRMNSP